MQTKKRGEWIMQDGLKIVYSVCKSESYSEAVGYQGEGKVGTILTEYDGVALKRIGAYAFFGCRTLVCLRIPVSVEEIEERAFSGCIRLKEIEYGGRVVDWGIVKKGYHWKEGVIAKEIVCSDGVVAL